MSFSKIRSAGWAANSVLTSAEMQSLDADHANAIDKTGDTVNGATLTLATGSTLALTGTTKVTTGSHPILIGSDVQVAISDNALINVGSASGPSNGNIYVGRNGSIAIDAASGGALTTTGAAAIICAEGNAIDLGGATFPTINSSSTIKTRHVWVDLAMPVAYGASWTNNVDGLVAPNSAATNRVSLPVTHHGAVLTTAVLYFTPPGGHASQPASLPEFEFSSRTLVAGAAAPGFATLASATYTWVSTVAYNAGTILTISMSPGVVLDTSTKIYSFLLANEYGANSITGGVFHGILLTYTVVALNFP